MDVDLASAPLFIQMTSLSSARMISVGYTAETLESDRIIRMVPVHLRGLHTYGGQVAAHYVTVTLVSEWLAAREQRNGALKEQQNLG